MFALKQTAHFAAGSRLRRMDFDLALHRCQFFLSAPPSQNRGSGPRQPDPLQTSVGYIGGDAYHRKGKGGRGGNRGGGGGFGGGGGSFGGGGRRGR